MEKYKKDLADLISEGDLLHLSIQYEALPKEFEKAYNNTKTKFSDFIKKIPPFAQQYQSWYSESQAIIKLLLPDRLADFIRHYEKPKIRKEITFENYVIVDFLQGLTITKGYYNEKVVGPEAALPQFRQQLDILKSVQRRFESSLFDIKQFVQADLFDSELDAARELVKNRFFRAAGAVTGVVLEKHLKQVSENHNLKLTKKDPTINDFNELLKQNNIIDIPQWRFIQHLGDLRNLCDHNKKKEPTSAEAIDLIDGVEKVSKTLF